jgi:RNA polymerase sigma-70 factor (ECF subfamily)
VESTRRLLELIRDGDGPARERLFRRYLPVLTRWATGRLPPGARDLVDTNDIVQVTLIRALDRIGEFEHRREGAFLFYLRRALLNQIRDQARRVSRRGELAPIPESMPDKGESPLQAAIRSDVLERYEAALDELTEAQREAVVLRLEMGFTYQEIADAIDSNSPDAARMLVTRGMVRLADAMSDLAPGRGEDT